MITREQVEHIAKLARIELTEEEKEKFTKELSSILDYFEKLNQVDTKKIESISQITGLSNIIRGDEIRSAESHAYRQAGGIRDKILKQVPNKKGDYYKVPKILE